MGKCFNLCPKCSGTCINANSGHGNLVINRIWHKCSKCGNEWNWRSEK